MEPRSEVMHVRIPPKDKKLIERKARDKQKKAATLNAEILMAWCERQRVADKRRSLK
jgi:hypothetical protein